MVIITTGVHIENHPPGEIHEDEGDDGKSLPRRRNDRGHTCTATASNGSGYDDDAALLAPTMNAHQPTMVNTATTNVDLEDGGDDIENYPPPRRKLTESEKGAIKHMAKDGLEISASGRLPRGWLQDKLETLNSSFVKPYHYANAKRQLQKNTKAKLKKEVIAEVTKRAIELKQKNNGRLNQFL